MTATAMRLEYRVLADNAADAVGRAKETCRAEGYVLRTVASVKQGEDGRFGRWVVTLVVKAPGEKR
jgi:hypothetical protein